MLNPSLRVLFYLCICTLVVFSACEDSTTVGADVFGPEDLEVFFDDDTELIATTVRLDPIKTYLATDEADACIVGTLPINRWNGAVFPTHYIGSLDDPKFGKTKSSIYTEVSFPVIPAFSGNLDSLVLVLNYDTTAFYGNRSEPFDIEIYRVLERFDAVGDAVFSNTAPLLFSEEPVGSRQGIEFTLDSLKVSIPGVDSTSLQPPGIRIPFDPPTLGGSILPLEIFNNSEAYTSTETFKTLLNGLYITTTTEGNVMPGIRMNSSSMELYYTDEDGERQIFQFALFRQDLISFNRIESDREGSDAATAASVGSPDNLIYVSGQDGFDVHIDLTDVTRFQNTALNKATLDFFISEDINDIESRFYPPSESLLISQLGDNNELICISDLSLGFPQTIVGSLFGGDIEEVTENGTVIRKYSMDITSHIQNFLSGSATSNIVLSVDSRTNNASRTILFGPEHPTFPAKLNLVYTAP